MALGAEEVTFPTKAFEAQVPNESDERQSEVQGPDVRSREARQETRSSSSLGILYFGADVLAKTPGQEQGNPLTPCCHASVVSQHIGLGRE